MLFLSSRQTMVYQQILFSPDFLEKRRRIRALQGGGPHLFCRCLRLIKHRVEVVQEVTLGTATKSAK